MFLSPSSRNCSDKIVFPVPGSPDIRYDFPVGRPPYVSWSRPAIPDGVRVCSFVLFSMSIDLL